MRSKLHGGNLIRAINAWTIGVARHTVTLDWSDQELAEGNGCEEEQEDDNVWGVPQEWECSWLYMKRKDGGRGLVSVHDSVKEKELGFVCQGE